MSNTGPSGRLIAWVLGSDTRKEFEDEMQMKVGGGIKFIFSKAQVHTWEGSVSTLE